MNNKNRIARKLMVLGAMCPTMILAGCCQFCDPPTPERDIVYAFDIPSGQSDCPAGTTFMDVSAGNGIDNLGGSGIVDRGGSGIVDRDDNRVKQFCYRPCVAGEEPVSNAVFTIWNSPSEFIVASSICALPVE